MSHGDQRLRDGGPWELDNPDVTLDGYFETWGVQQSTADNGPTLDGRTHGHRVQPFGHPVGMTRIQEDNFR